MNAAWPWVVRVFGLGLITHETLARDFDRPYLIGGALLMMAGIDVIEAYFRSKR
jgi:hypothetical protein